MVCRVVLPQKSTNKRCSFSFFHVLFALFSVRGEKVSSVRNGTIITIEELLTTISHHDIWFTARSVHDLCVVTRHHNYHLLLHFKHTVGHVHYAKPTPIPFRWRSWGSRTCGKCLSSSNFCTCRAVMMFSLDNVHYWKLKWLVTIAWFLPRFAFPDLWRLTGSISVGVLSVRISRGDQGNFGYPRWGEGRLLIGFWK